jgi:hypothetical protein
MPVRFLSGSGLLAPGEECKRDSGDGRERFVLLGGIVAVFDVGMTIDGCRGVCVCGGDEGNGTLAVSGVEFMALNDS